MLLRCIDTPSQSLPVQEGVRRTALLACLVVFVRFETWRSNQTCNERNDADSRESSDPTEREAEDTGRFRFQKGSAFIARAINALFAGRWLTRPVSVVGLQGLCT